MSFNVPYVGFGPQKVKAYIESWECDSAAHFAEKESFAELFLHIIHRKPCDSIIQKEHVKTTFGRLRKLYIGQ